MRMYKRQMGLVVHQFYSPFISNKEKKIKRKTENFDSIIFPFRNLLHITSFNHH